MTATGEREGQLVVREPYKLVHRLPGCDMIRLGTQHKHRHTHVAHRYHLTSHRELVCSQFVAQIKLLEILLVHEVRHARTVSVPGHEIVEPRLLPQVVAAHHAGVNQV